MALLACVPATALLSAAQEDSRPQITPGERKVPRKKDAGPRAIGLLQLGTNGKTSIVPVAILVNGKFFDATAYKADPVPMALDSGTVYEGERTGNSLGLFTVGSALHANHATNNQPPWIGTGVWHPVGTEPTTKGIKAETTPVGIDNSDAPPRLTRDPNAVNKPPDSAAPPTTDKTPPADSSKASRGSDPDEPPRLNRPTEPAPSAAPSNPPPAGSGDSKSGDSKPETKPETKTETHASTPASDSGASEGNRPRLRRGKPEEIVADEDVPGYSKPGTKSSANQGKLVDTAASKGDVKLVPAISDAFGPDPHSYTFEWIKGEEGDRRQQMSDMAKQEIRAYLTGRAKNAVTAKPARPASAKTPAKGPEPVLENVQMIAYDLWVSNVPVIIFSADAHMPMPPAGAPHSEQDELQYSIVLVAYPDIYSNLRKIYAGVTDKYHLDVTPRLELIDAVDADGDRRGELIFRQTSDQGTGWVIYRATADKLWKMFDSLSPQ